MLDSLRERRRVESENICLSLVANTSCRAVLEGLRLHVKAG